jgi:hypothetical protein
MDNAINISHLQRTNAADQMAIIKDLVTVLEAASSHLVLPDEVQQALTRLRALVDKETAS